MPGSPTNRRDKDKNESTKDKKDKDKSQIYIPWSLFILMQTDHEAFYIQGVEIYCMAKTYQQVLNWQS